MLRPNTLAEFGKPVEAREGTPLILLRGLAGEIGRSALDTKGEGHRLGPSRQTNDLALPEDRSVAVGMTTSCATDGNHGYEVAQGAGLTGCRCTICIRSGVSDERAAAITRHGAGIVRVAGNDDGPVAEASRVADAKGWITVPDTSSPGNERIPGMVMQGYTTLLDGAEGATDPALSRAPVRPPATGAGRPGHMSGART